MIEIKALIFDFDGLILETETPVFESWRECYLAHGHKLNIEEYAACVGSDETSFDPVTDLENRHSESIDWQLWTEKRRELIQKALDNRPPLPGIVDRLEEATNQSLPCAVASSSPRSWVEPFLDKLDLRRFFKNTVCLDDVKKPKPDPELFLKAAESLGVKPNEALVFEDSLNGLRAAKTAGMFCVVIPNQVTRHLNLQEASLQLESLGDQSLSEILFRL
jgi:putative hydrolase of the HAD superfamily